MELIPQLLHLLFHQLFNLFTHILSLKDTMVVLNQLHYIPLEMQVEEEELDLLEE